ncbi:hypothetical protein ACJIZ3_008890 [Penstemon smallii]|uniref:Uncharacterized protein n=1 Tax=Penstemon smallii TaxID=265156 RepID=A0ABD3TB36_9LAMI
MRGIWGRRDGEELLEVKCNEFGDGKHGLLNYSSWHKVPMECKEKLWKILQSKFKLDESSKTWTMQKFGKKLRDWRNQLKKKCYKKNLPLHDQMKLKDPRVHEEHFEYLIGYWSTDRAQEISRRNQVSRSRRIHNHTTGTKSFARVRKEQRDQLAHVPTRAEQFKHCFTKKDGTQTVAVKTAIDKMQEIDNENSDASNKVLSRNDSYAQVMGLDKNGRVGMCGPGVCPSIVFNDTFTRGANENMLIKTLQHENHQLRSELHQFKSQAINEPHHEILVNDSTQDEMIGNYPCTVCWVLWV